MAILIEEDNSGFCNASGSNPEKYDYETFIADNAVEALEISLRIPPELKL